MKKLETELYRELGGLTKQKDAWRANIPYIHSLLDYPSVKIKAKALWMLGEMGLQYPCEVAPCVDKIISFFESEESLLRERALNALGRIGRGRFVTVEPLMEKILRHATDDSPNVRLAVIWASENIATNTPDAYAAYLPVFADLLHDGDERVRMEAPEMFRVIGKRLPRLVQPFLNTLQHIADTDPHPVVRIHAAGAIRAATITAK